MSYMSYQPTGQSYFPGRREADRGSIEADVRKESIFSKILFYCRLFLSSSQAIILSWEGKRQAGRGEGVDRGRCTQESQGHLCQDLAPICVVREPAGNTRFHPKDNEEVGIDQVLSKRFHPKVNEEVRIN